MSNVVQEWVHRRPPAERTAHLSDKQLAEAIERTVLENGIEKPRGYKVTYYYNAEVEQHHFGRSHPMKPWRLQLTKQLVIAHGLHYAMEGLHMPPPATKDEIIEFHSEDYVQFLSQITPENMNEYENELKNYKFGDDCPVFDGLFDYCSLYTGSTVSAARSLSTKQSDIAISWAGGLHHAKKSEASGFCYVNDIVLAILELMRVYSRILYIDIDVHHGDGVEQAFYSSDRVMTLSFHKYDPLTFFPGTGGFEDHGPDNNKNPGAHFSLNVPLHDGIDDHEYTSLFGDVVDDCVETFQPTAVVLQCGADSLGGDRLGKFNLNIKAHGDCLSMVKDLGLPTLVLGGGGYTPRNVARLWCHETALCVGASLGDVLPQHIPYRQAFEGVENGDGFLYPELHNIEGKRHTNEHDAKYLDKCRRKIREQLRYIKGAPSVQMTQMPRDIWKLRDELDRERKEDNEAVRKDREKAIGGRGEML